MKGDPWAALGQGRPNKEKMYEIVLKVGGFEDSAAVQDAYEKEYKISAKRDSIVERVSARLGLSAPGKRAAPPRAPSRTPSRKGQEEPEEGQEEPEKEGQEEPEEEEYEEDEETAAQRQSFKQRALQSVADLAEELFGEGRLWADEQMKPLVQEKEALEAKVRGTKRHTAATAARGGTQLQFISQNLNNVAPQVKHLEDELLTKQRTIDEMASSNADLRRKSKLLKQQLIKQRVPSSPAPPRSPAVATQQQQQLQQQQTGQQRSSQFTPAKRQAELQESGSANKSKKNGGAPSQSPTM